MMNDLERLEVNPEAVESSIIEELLRQVGFKRRMGKLAIPEGLMKGMGGKLICRSKENEWFEVEIWLALAA